jgi:hypothetical protein
LLRLVNSPVTSAVAGDRLTARQSRGFSMFFKRKPKPPLENAFQMVNDATKIAYKYQHDRNYMPSEKELRLFDALSETLFRNYSTVTRIARKMHQRARGEPEDPTRFIDPTMF